MIKVEKSWFFFLFFPPPPFFFNHCVEIRFDVIFDGTIRVYVGFMIHIWLKMKVIEFNSIEQNYSNC